MAAFSNPLQSYASYGDKVISPGIFPYIAAKHWECCAATAAAGPFNPRKTIGQWSYPPLI